MRNSEFIVPSSKGGECRLFRMCVSFETPIHSSAMPLLCGFHPQCSRHPDQIGHRSRSHLLHNMTAMHFDGDLTELDAGCDLFAHEPTRNQRHNFTFARGKGCEMYFEVRDRILMFTTRSVVLDCVRDRVK